MKKWEPEHYDKSILQYRIATEMFQSLLPLKGDENILDIGSGTGKVTDYISRQVPNGKVTGLDCSKEMVQYSRKKYNSQNLTFVETNVLDMSYKQCFHIIVSFWTLSWIEDQALALIKIVNALKPNGRMLLMYPLRHDAYDVTDQMLKTPKWKPYFERGFTPRPFITEMQYRSITEKIPDIYISVTKKEIPCYFKDIAEMKLSIRSWMPHLDNLNEDLKEEFLNEFIESYSIYRKTLQLVMYFTVLEIRGHKNLAYSN